ncbi:hypothetical protein FOZ63_026452 [Perkinsus olseni]|uniref:Uncharacterized protein n=2 Tax=Perkinsus olseni TaxID=32597 RepID=A0A7J6UPK0_PEROL|nr:hypothetical protein FOZ63_026452 [Perkinsus olseni]
MAGTGSDSDKIDYDDHPFTVLSVEDSILRLPFYMGEEFADESTDDPRGSGVELSLMDVTTGDRVIYPGRGNRCEHLEIVDLMNSVRPAQTLVDAEALELSPPWRCHRCGQVYNCCSDLEVDEWLQRIIQQTTDTSVRLYLDGSWADSAGLYVIGDGSAEKVDLTTDSADESSEPQPKRRREAESDEQTPEVDLTSSNGDDDAPREAIVDLDSDDD